MSLPSVVFILVLFKIDPTEEDLKYSIFIRKYSIFF